MKHIIIGTAGHIDHGKTTLIKALTGTDTDRLMEEKKRGITIDLGFAQLPLGQDIEAGIVDVPGHEKFIRNMLAGIGGVDIALLVISAEEGIMPQTKEHIDILDILNIERGVIALTKVDVVDKEWLDMAKTDVQAYLEGTFLENAPIIEVSAKTGKGLSELKDTLERLALATPPKNSAGHPRLPIDRAFNMSGKGVVITGTLMEGNISVGDTLSMYPSQRPVKVRAIQTHGQSIETAEAGQRTAINLGGIKKDEIQRGDVLTTPDSLAETSMLDVRLRLLSEIPRPLNNRARVRFHYGTSEVMARVVLLDKEVLKAGENAFAQIRLEHPVALRVGDHFVLRYYSPMETMGGGVVLDSKPYKHKRFKEQVIDGLVVREDGDVEEILVQAIQRHSKGLVPFPMFRHSIGGTEEQQQRALDELTKEGIIFSLSDNVLIHVDYLEYVRAQVAETLQIYHKKNPLQPGMPKEELRHRLFGEKKGKASEDILSMFLEDHTMTDGQTVFSLYGFKPQQKHREVQEIESYYRSFGFTPPTTFEALDALKKKSSNDYKEIIHRMKKEGALIALNDKHLILVETLQQAINQITNYIKRHDQITLAETRDLLVVSRKYALLVLDYMDAKKITKKVDDYRVLIG